VKQGCLDQDSIRVLHSYIEQIRDAIGESHIFNMITENDMKGIQPMWISIMYQVLQAHNMIQCVDRQRTLPLVDLGVCHEVLRTMAQWYKLAGKTVFI
jgi:hypothetical protein